MCARANRGSVPDSLHALIGSLVTVVSAVLALVIALATAPVRLVKTRPTKHGKPARTDKVEVQVHLSQRERVRDIERSCRAALGRAARTWAPFPLPLDRVEVLSSAPPLGDLDLVGTPDGSTGYADLMPGSESYELADALLVQVVGLDDLIRLKRASGKNAHRAQKDLHDAVVLEEIRARGTAYDPPTETGS